MLSTRSRVGEKEKEQSEWVIIGISNVIRKEREREREREKEKERERQREKERKRERERERERTQGWGQEDRELSSLTISNYLMSHSHVSTMFKIHSSQKEERGFGPVSYFLISMCSPWASEAHNTRAKPNITTANRPTSYSLHYSIHRRTHTVMIDKQM